MKYKNDGLLGNVYNISRQVLHASQSWSGEGYYTGQTIVFLDPLTGRRMAGPVTVKTYDTHSERLVTSSPVIIDILKDGAAVYISGSQDEVNPPTVSKR